MMKVRFLKAHLGYEAGDVDELNSARALSFIDNGIAELVETKYEDPATAPGSISEKVQREDSHEKQQHTTHTPKNAHAGRKK